ncbi:MAG: hypothetical protein WD468_00375 [Pirellulales bacterium]
MRQFFRTAAPSNRKVAPIYRTVGLLYLTLEAIYLTVGVFCGTAGAFHLTVEAFQGTVTLFCRTVGAFACVVRRVDRVAETPDRIPQDGNRTYNGQPPDQRRSARRSGGPGFDSAPPGTGAGRLPDRPQPRSMHRCNLSPILIR